MKPPYHRLYQQATLNEDSQIYQASYPTQPKRRLAKQSASPNHHDADFTVRLFIPYLRYSVSSLFRIFVIPYLRYSVSFLFRIFGI
ncbi:hypothetical protein [Arenicella xantha]|uniref:hypothetical protein n=1 Tax=Arenicella xantha TaxID=644221 RepID=UPI0011BE0B4E|nr:hypothetical protein [Arenicella xantha]